MGNASSLVKEKSPQFFNSHPKIIKVSSKKFEAGDFFNTKNATKHDNKSQKYDVRADGNKNKPEDLCLEDFEEIEESINDKVQPFKLKNWADKVKVDKKEVSPRKLNAIKGSRQERHAILADLKKAKIIEGQIVEAPGGKSWTLSMDNEPIRYPKPRLESQKKMPDRKEMLETQRQNQMRAEQKRKDEIKKKMAAVREKTYKAHQVQETRKAQEREFRDKVVNELDSRQMAVERNKQRLVEERKSKILKEYHKKQQLLQKRLELELKGLLDDNANPKFELNEALSDNEFEYNLEKEKKENVMVRDRREDHNYQNQSPRKAKESAYLGTGSIHQPDVKSEKVLDLNDDFWENTVRPTYAAAHGPVNVNSPRNQSKETKSMPECKPENEPHVEPECSKQKPTKNRYDFQDQLWANDHMNSHPGNATGYCEAGSNHIKVSTTNEMDYSIDGAYNIQIKEKPGRLNLACREVDNRNIALNEGNNREDEPQCFNPRDGGRKSEKDQQRVSRGSEMYQYFWKKMNACESDLEMPSTSSYESRSPKAAMSSKLWTEPLAPRRDKYYKTGTFNIEGSTQLRRPNAFGFGRNQEIQNSNSGNVDLSGRTLPQRFAANNYETNENLSSSDASPKNLNKGSYSSNSFSLFEQSTEVPLKGVQSDKHVDLMVPSPSSGTRDAGSSQTSHQREAQRRNACDRKGEIPPHATAESYKLDFLRELELN